MFFANDGFVPVDDDREELALESAEQPPGLWPHLELVSADSHGPASLEPIDLDPPTPMLPYAAI